MVTTLMTVLSCSPGQKNEIAGQQEYLAGIKAGLSKQWPGNRTINLVFHGHSVPSGYFKTPLVNTMDAYPMQVLKELKETYPFAVVNVINTAIGGENSWSGARRFREEVLVHKPDVLFIDYALNDIGLGLKKAGEAWEFMIREALGHHIKVILLTPSPDQRINLLENNNRLEQHARQITALAGKYGTGLADSYGIFRNLAASGDTIASYMSQVNHPNAKGHRLIALEIMKYFR